MFEINTKNCGSYALYLSNKGCLEDSFRTIQGLIVCGANASLDPTSEKTLLQQIKEMQYLSPSKRGYYLSFQDLVSVSGGDLRLAQRADGFPLSIEENVPVLGATLPIDLRSIYYHKQLRKLNRRNIKFYAVTDTKLVLGETDSTGKLLPVSGLLHKYLMLPSTTGGNNEAADITLYYASAQSLGDDIAFAALADNVNLAKELQQIAELVMVADVATAGKAKLTFKLARGGEDVTEQLGAAIAAGGVIKAYATGSTEETAIVLSYATGVVTATFAAAFTGTLVLGDPETLIAEEVGSIDEGTYAAEPISVVVTAP